jgi:hypothetical protein
MVLKRIRSLLMLFVSLSLSSCTPGPNSPGGNWGHMMGYGYGGGFMWITIYTRRKDYEPIYV